MFVQSCISTNSNRLQFNVLFWFEYFCMFFYFKTLHSDYVEILQLVNKNEDVFALLDPSC